MMIAIGAPGALPRMWLETISPAMLAVNIERGEVATVVAEHDDAGRPVPATLPASTNVVWPGQQAAA